MASETDTITIQLCLNTNRTASKICKIQCVESSDKFYKKLSKMAKDKLRIKKKKTMHLYLIQTGEEITANNINQLISTQYAANFTKTLSISVSLGEAYQGKIHDAESIKKDICLIRYIASLTAISSDAQKQLEACQRLKGMKLVCGQPDLHPGKGFPIGVSLVSADFVYPYLIGTDIGCGMSLIQTNVPKDAANAQRISRWINDINLDDAFVNKLIATEHAQDNNKTILMNNILSNKIIDWPNNKSQEGIDVEQVLLHGINLHDYDDTLGTIGHGNHFAELQNIEQIVDDALFKELGLNENKLFLMIHSGSRGFGADILDTYLETHSASKGLQVCSDEFKKYMFLHDSALKWARKNRMIIAQRFVENMGNGALYDFNHCQCFIDIYHNYLCAKEKNKFKDVQRELKSKMDTNNDSSDINEEKEMKGNEDKEEMWYIHRKGAAPSDDGYVVIPGSRGAHSYIVKPINEDNDHAGYSLAHGAGRKLMRTQAIKKMSKKYPNVNQLTKTSLKSHVICHDKALMYEEAPGCYKDITNVIQDLVDHNLIRVVAILKPIITYKTKGKQYEAKHSKHHKKPKHKVYKGAPVMTFND